MDSLGENKIGAPMVKLYMLCEATIISRIVVMIKRNAYIFFIKNLEGGDFLTPQLKLTLLVIISCHQISPGHILIYRHLLFPMASTQGQDNHFGQIPLDRQKNARADVLGQYLI
jgi:hypothetical protein